MRPRKRDVSFTGTASEAGTSTAVRAGSPAFASRSLADSKGAVGHASRAAAPAGGCPESSVSPWPASRNATRPAATSRASRRTITPFREVSLNAQVRVDGKSVTGFGNSGWEVSRGPALDCYATGCYSRKTKKAGRPAFFCRSSVARHFRAAPKTGFLRASPLGPSSIGPGPA
jgi:hypothetical protein